MNTPNGLKISVLGELEVVRAGTPLALPRSKKTRALLAYLAVTGRAHRRERLCGLLWDLPDDPRGALRWSLSKLRPLVDEDGLARLAADRDSVRFVPEGAEIDVLEVRKAAVRGLANLEPAALAGLAQAFRGEALEGLDLPNCPDFQSWLVAQRDEARRLHTQVSRALVATFGPADEAALPHARGLVRLQGHDSAAWIDLVRRLAAVGRRLEAEQQVEAGREALSALGPEPAAALDRAWRQIAAKSPARDPVPAAAPPAARAPDSEPEFEPRSDPPAAAAETVLTPPEGPSIAVLPFENLAGDPAEAYLSVGIAADLAERLGHGPRLFVTARGSVLEFAGAPADLAPVRDGLGVRNVLTGTLRRRGESIEVSARLSDAVSDRSLWKHDFRGPLDGIFTLERDLAEAVFQAIAPESGGVPDLTFGLPYPKTEAWCLYQRGSLHLHRRTEPDLARAVGLFEDALGLDPGFARARAAAVDAMYYQVALDYLTPTANLQDRAMGEAKRALEAGPKDGAVHCALGQAHMLAREPQAAVPAFETSVRLNPSLAWAHYGLGAAKVLSGAARDAAPHIERAIRLSPRDRNMGSFLLRLADAALFAHHYEDAIKWARRAIREPLFQWSRYAVLLSALGHLGRRDEARKVLDELLILRPDFSIDLVRSTHLYTDKVKMEFVAEPQLFVDQDEFAHYLDGLRKAGVPVRQGT